MSKLKNTWHKWLRGVLMILGALGVLVATKTLQDMLGHPTNIPYWTIPLSTSALYIFLQSKAKFPFEK